MNLNGHWPSVFKLGERESFEALNTVQGMSRGYLLSPPI